MDYEKEINDLKEEMEYLKEMLNSVLDEQVYGSMGEFEDEFEEGNEVFEIETTKDESPMSMEMEEECQCQLEVPSIKIESQ
jgi:hypothetical protein